MKKNLILSALLAVVSVFASAQVIFDDAEGYPAFAEDSAIAANSKWTFFDGDNQNTIWFGLSTFWPSASYDKSFLIMTPDSLWASTDGGQTAQVVGTKNKNFTPYSGNQYFASVGAFDYDKGVHVATNDWMISPALSGNNPVRISFYAKSFQCGNEEGLNDKFRVYGSTTGNNVADFIGKTGILHANTTPYKWLKTEDDADWHLFSYEFPAGTKYVAINCISDGGYIFCVDDILIEEIYSYDLEMVVVGLPDYSCQLTNAETVEVLVANKGQNAVTSYNVYYQIGETGTPVMETSTTPIAAGDSAVYTFTTPADLSFAMDMDSVRCWVEVAGDGLVANDTSDWYFTGVPASATVPYFNDFSADNDLKGFSLLDANNDGYTWHITEDEDDNNNVVWFCQTFNAKQAANDWLFTSCFDLAEGDYAIEFLYKGYDKTSTEKLGVYYGMDTDPNAMNLISNITFTSDVYAKANELFHIPAAGTYYFGFKASSDKKADGDIYVDNIHLIEAPSYDILAVGANVPGVSCERTDMEEISITVKNTGTSAINTFNVYYQIGNKIPVVDTVNHTINSGATYTYTFANPVDLTMAAPINVTVWASVDGDVNHLNDTANLETYTTGLVQSVVKYPYVNDFDEEADRLNWTTINGLENNCYWNINAEEGYWYHIGLKHYGAPYTGGEDWLVSSCFDLEKRNYELSFNYAVRDENYTSSLRVFLGQKVSDQESDYELIEELNMFDNIDWEKHSVDFKVPEAGTYYIAFYGYDNQWSMFLDSVSIKKSTVGVNENSAAKVALYPNPAQNEISLRCAEMMSTVSIYDMFGKNINNYEVDAFEAQINVTTLAPGMYLARINTENGTIVKKFTVQK